MKFTTRNTASPAPARGFLCLALAGLLALSWAAVPAAAEDAPGKASAPQVGTAIGNLAPDFTAENFHGGTVRLADYRGKVVLLDFWASWCGPCMHELPTLVEIMNRYPADKFAIIGVSLDMQKSLARMKQVIADNKLEYPIPYDGKGWRNAVSTLYGVRSIPATFILDGDGVIVGKNKRGRELVQYLDQLVQPE